MSPFLDIESKIDHHIEIMEILHVLREDRCSSVLLPELQCLNLADNQVSDASVFQTICGRRSRLISVLPSDRLRGSRGCCCSFPKALWITYPLQSSNHTEERYFCILPDSCRRRLLDCSNSFSCFCLNPGETALLTYFLQDKLGIKIKREKDEDLLQPPLKVCVYPGWKVGCVLHWQERWIFGLMKTEWPNERFYFSTRKLQNSNMRRIAEVYIPL